MEHLTENQWINYYRFQRFPFDRPEAGNEEFARPEFLATCFVEPSCFERVLGQADAPVTALVFAERGTGKTACRVMVDYYCHQGQVNRERLQSLNQPSYVLSVSHIHLHQVLSMARQEASSTIRPLVRVEHHVVEIIRRAVPALTSLVAKVPELGENIKNLTIGERQDLSWLILKYNNYLTSAQAGFLHALGIDLFTENQSPIGFQPREDPSIKQPPWIQLLFQGRSQVSPLDHLTEWARLMHRVGVSATYVLVDGVDEFEESASDPSEALAIIRPLLTSLRLMDGTPYLALKFFLPAHIEHFVRTDEAIRRDRGFIFENIVWQVEDLIKILRKRLAALKKEEDRDKNRLEVPFDALCVPELHGQIEVDLANWSRGNPRHLMILCGLMIAAHCSRNIHGQDDPYQLNKADLQIALEQFEARVGGSPQLINLSTTLTVQTLLAQGENDQVEFKSSMRWDFKANAENKSLQLIIAKTIAGMLNSKGGTLLIGIADDGTVLGIEKDLQTLAKQNLDGFQLALTDIVKAYLGLEYMVYLHVRFEQVDNKWVCLVLIERSHTPVYFIGGSTLEFWVRFGNSTRQLDIKATVSYIQTHWK